MARTKKIVGEGKGIIPSKERDRNSEKQKMDTLVRAKDQAFQSSMMEMQQQYDQQRMIDKQWERAFSESQRAYDERKKQTKTVPSKKRFQSTVKR